MIFLQVEDGPPSHDGRRLQVFETGMSKRWSHAFGSVRGELEPCEATSIMRCLHMRCLTTVREFVDSISPKAVQAFAPMFDELNATVALWGSR